VGTKLGTGSGQRNFPRIKKKMLKRGATPMVRWGEEQKVQFTGALVDLEVRGGRRATPGEWRENRKTATTSHSVFSGGC